MMSYFFVLVDQVSKAAGEKWRSMSEQVSRSLEYPDRFCISYLSFFIYIVVFSSTWVITHNVEVYLVA
jgi:hypothetical protein